jgi:hypothetical protein
MRSVRGDECVWWGRRKMKGRGYMGGGEKKKKKKGKKKWGVCFTCMVGKKGSRKKRRKKI